MNVYEAVKSTVTTRQAAEYYGIKVTGSGIQRQTINMEGKYEIQIKSIEEKCKSRGNNIEENRFL